MNKTVKNLSRKMFACSVLLLLVFALLCAAGCGEKQKTYEINPQEMTAEVLEKVRFASELQELDRDSLSVMYTIEEGIEVCAYVAGGALADEFIVFTAADETAANKMLTNVKTHIAERSELFADYAPAEVVKLKKAYTLQKGKYVIVCITDDIENAKSVINQHF